MKTFKELTNPEKLDESAPAREISRSLMIVADELARVILYGGNVSNSTRKVTKELENIAKFPANVESDPKLLNKNFSRAVDGLHSALISAFN